MTQRLSVLVPVYRNEDTLLELRDRIQQALREIDDIDYKIAFVDDNSPDGSWSVIKSMALDDPSVVGLRLASNVGQLRALCAGWDVVGGDIMVSIDADLEQPPEAIPQLISEFRDGHDLVTTKRIGRSIGSIRGVGSLAVNVLARMLRIPVSDVGSSLLVCSPQLAAEVRRVVDRTGRQMVLPTAFDAAVNPTTVAVESSTRSTSAYALSSVVHLGGELIAAELGPVAARRALLVSACVLVLSAHAPSRDRAIRFAAFMAGLGLVGLSGPHRFRRSRTEHLYDVDAQVGHV